MPDIIITEGLLSDVKNYLDITWTDPAAEEKLTGQLRRGIAYIIAKTGVSISAFDGSSADYDGRAQELLFNYVLYDRAGSADQFKTNYRSDILGLKIRQEVANASQSKG